MAHTYALRHQKQSLICKRVRYESLSIIISMTTLDGSVLMHNQSLNQEIRQAGKFVPWFGCWGMEDVSALGPPHGFVGSCKVLS